MSWQKRFRVRVNALFSKRRLEREMADEMREHLESRAERYLQSGMSPEEARYAAQRDFGGMEQLKERCRDQRGWVWLESLVKDVKFAALALARRPGFTASAVLTLSLGVGANSAIFSIIDAVLLRPLPYRNPSQLVTLNETERAPGRYPFAGPDFLDWKAQNSTFQDMTLFAWSKDMNLSSEGRADHIRALPTAANFFSVLGVDPLLGRTWAPDEDQPGKDDVVVLSYGFWESRFVGDPQAVGQSIELDARKFTIIGVMPASFRFPWSSQVWIPQLMDSKSLGQRGTHWANAIGRLKPGVTKDAAQADLKLIAERLEKQNPETNDKVGAGVTSLRDDLVGNSRSSLCLMLAAVGLVLLIACANVANMLLARAIERQKEMAVRSSLGASRIRLVRQLLTESVILSLAGGAAGLLLAWYAVTLFSRATSYGLPQFNAVQISGTVLAFTFALATATGMLFGLFPALQMSQPDLHMGLKGGAGSAISPGRRRRFTSNALVVTEIALSLLLLDSAGLLLKDFALLRRVDIGVRRDGVWTAAVQLLSAKYITDRQCYDFAQNLMERLRRINGVDAVALSDHLPLEGGSNYTVYLRGQTSVSSNISNQLVESHTVSSEYFHALGVRLLLGRQFTPVDAETALALDLRVNQLYAGNSRPRADQTNSIVYPCVINESMARFFWPEQNPLGKMFSTGNDTGPWKEVMGVVSDVRQWNLTEKPAPEAYDAFDGASRQFLILHTSLPVANLASQVRLTLGQIDSNLPLYAVRSMDEVVAEKTQGQQFSSFLIGSFAGLATVLSAVGIYGVLSHVVAQRTREIGIRMAIGARPREVLRLVLGQGGKLIGAGLFVGAGITFAVERFLQSMLFQTRSYDLMTLGAIALLLVVVGGLACCIPAHRAVRIDPVTAMRSE